MVWGRPPFPMKFVNPQFDFFFSDPEVRRNVRSLLKYVALLVAVVALYAVVFHLLMLHVEGRPYSWVTGFYWTLTVMSTLGFGDITFESDAGRLFSIVVLVSGVVLLLIVLPFAFIRFFYAPWLEARIRARAPRELPPETAGHVIICALDSVAPGLVRRLAQEGIEAFVIEPDRALAAERHLEGLPVVAGEVDSRATYEALRAPRARLVLANVSDPVNANITLTVREVAPEVPIVAVASQDEAADVLTLCGASHVLPLRRRLGEHLANRVEGEHAQVHVIGQYRDLLLAEVPVHRTPLAGHTIRETRLRETTGASIVGIWERGRLRPARPETLLEEHSVPVVIGREAQLAALDELLAIYGFNPNPVLVIGAGSVGSAAVAALLAREVAVHVVERDPALGARMRARGVPTFEGNAADYERLAAAGLLEAPSVLLTTGDDAVNIYLASYCRRLNPEVRIVSRITLERNVEAIHRAGADFVLSYASLGAEAVLSIALGRELVVLGEGTNLFSAPVPRALAGKTLAESQIGARTGLSVIALQLEGRLDTDLRASSRLEAGAQLLMVGHVDQQREFAEAFGT